MRGSRCRLSSSCAIAPIRFQADGIDAARKRPAAAEPVAALDPAGAAARKDQRRADQIVRRLAPDLVLRLFRPHREHPVMRREIGQHPGGRAVALADRSRPARRSSGTATRCRRPASAAGCGTARCGADRRSSRRAAGAVPRPGAARSRNTGTSASARASSSAKSGGPPGFATCASAIASPLSSPAARTRTSRRRAQRRQSIAAPTRFVCGAALIDRVALGRDCVAALAMRSRGDAMIYMVEMDFPHPERLAPNGTHGIWRISGYC